MNSNGIDVHDLDSFIVSDIAGYVAQTQRYDFETFDDRYGELEPLETFLVAYIRANIEEF